MRRSIAKKTLCNETARKKPPPAPPFFGVSPAFAWHRRLAVRQDHNRFPMKRDSALLASMCDTATVQIVR
jgi:hypothetical protein